MDIEIYGYWLRWMSDGYSGAERDTCLKRSQRSSWEDEDDTGSEREPGLSDVSSTLLLGRFGDVGYRARPGTTGILSILYD